jgi:hypothetical protein
VIAHRKGERRLLADLADERGVLLPRALGHRRVRQVRDADQLAGEAGVEPAELILEARQRRLELGHLRHRRVGGGRGGRVAAA